MKLKATIRRHGVEAKVMHAGNRNYQVFAGDQLIDIHKNLSNAVSAASRFVILGPEERETRLYFARRWPMINRSGDKKEFDIQLESN